MGHLMFVHMHLQIMSQKNPNCVTTLLYNICSSVLLFIFLLNMLNLLVTCMQTCTKTKAGSNVSKNKYSVPSVTCQRIKAKANMATLGQTHQHSSFSISICVLNEV